MADSPVTDPAHTSAHPEPEGRQRPDETLLLNRLYREHAKRISQQVRQVFGDGPPEPEDLVQTAFAKLAELGNLSDIQHPRAFIYRMAVNLGLNSIDRYKVARRFAERELKAANAPIVDETTPEAVYTMRQRLTRARTAFASLTDKQKTIVTRVRFHGETYAQISQDTGWSPADISRQMKAALIAMQAAAEWEDE